MRVMCVSVQTPGCLGNPQRKGPGHRTSLLQGPLPAADPLISGNKEGRVSNSSKIASAVRGVEGCVGRGEGRGGSDATAHVACISSSQLKKQASELISVSTGNPERRQNSKWKDSPPSPFFLWV